MDGEHTVLLATHMTEDLDRLADYLIYLQEGQILYAGIWKASGKNTVLWREKIIK